MEYDQACAVPYKIEKGKVMFCLITSRSGDWIFPKGCIDPGETPDETALKEADEEAGLEGRIVATLESFSYTKRGYKLRCIGKLMEVTQSKDRWLEKKVRERRFVQAQEAQQLIERQEMQLMLTNALENLSHI